MSAHKPSFASDLGGFTAKGLGSIAGEVEPFTVYVEIPSTVFNRYEALMIQGDLTTIDGDLLMALAGYEISQSKVLPIKIPGFSISIGKGEVVAPPTEPTTGGDVVIPPESISGQNPYFADMMIVGNTANRLTIVKSIRYYPAGSAPQYQRTDYIVLTFYYESIDNGNTWYLLGSNIGSLDATRSLLALNARSINGAYCTIDYHLSKIWAGSDGVMATEVVGAFGSNRPVWVGCSTSRFVVITAPYNIVYTSEDARTWTNKGAATGLPYEFVYNILTNGQVSSNVAIANIAWLGTFWFSRLGYITTDPDARTGWYKPESNLAAILPTSYPDSIGLLQAVYNGSRYAAIARYDIGAGIMQAAIVVSLDFITWASLGPATVAILLAVGTEFYGSDTSGTKLWKTTDNGTVWSLTDVSVSSSDLDRVVSGGNIFLTKPSGLNPNWPTPSTISQYAVKRSADMGLTFQTCITI